MFAARKRHPNGDIRIADRVVIITDNYRMNQASGVRTTSELRKSQIRRRVLCSQALRQKA
jgi:hypothetical protein